jgi:hypothetical protein
MLRSPLCRHLYEGVYHACPSLYCFDDFFTFVCCIGQRLLRRSRNIQRSRQLLSCQYQDVEQQCKEYLRQPHASPEGYSSAKGCAATESTAMGTSGQYAMPDQSMCREFFDCSQWRSVAFPQDAQQEMSGIKATGDSYLQ